MPPQTGQVLAAGFADLAVLPQTFTPYMSQTMAWYTMLLGPPGKNGSQNWTDFSNSQFDQLVTTASQQLNPDTARAYYDQADTHAVGRDGLAAPLRRADGPGLEPHDRRRHAMPRSTSLLWFAQLWAVRVPESTNNTTPSLPGQ